ncbi:MAG: hypothetical protein CBR30_07475 [Dictyoglomus sp. NZ13-RE01]|nr:MAG: hypothetical protein CBR30_07475 [Dictyoglomus sp. NZ13-RE01]
MELEVFKLFGFLLGIGGGSLAFLLYFFYRFSFFKKIKIKRHLISLSFVTAFFISSIFSPHRTFSLGNFFLLFLLYIVYLFFREEDFSKDVLDSLLDYWILGAMILAFAGINIYFYKGVYAETYFIRKNGLGTLLAMTLPISQIKIITSKEKLLYFLSTFIILSGLILTMSQGAIIGLLIGEIVLFILGEKRIRRQIKTIGMIGVLLLGLFIGRSLLVKDNLFSFFLTRLDLNSSSKTERIYIWKASWHMFLDYPITGVGFGCFSLEYPRYKLPQAYEQNHSFAHNLPLNLLAETGILGFFTFSFLTLSFFWKGIKGYIRSKDLTLLSLIGGFTAYMVHQLFDGTMWSLHFGIFFFLLGAIFNKYYET